MVVGGDIVMFDMSLIMEGRASRASGSNRTQCCAADVVC